MNVRRSMLVIAIALAALGAWQIASAAWIHAKAALAQQLIAIAWKRSDGNQAPRPWPGADMRPVARLTVPSRGVSVFVLDEASGRALAFGPARLGGTAAPGAAGNSVIVAHRDTHFAFLKELSLDDEIDVETLRGQRSRYRVRETRVVDKHDVEIALPGGDDRLTLVTCYPFNAVRPGTPLRYVVVAEPAA